MVTPPILRACARPVVRGCISSIVSNPNAMFWLTRIRNQDAYTAEHCVRVGMLAIVLAASPGNKLTRFVELVLDADGHRCVAQVLDLSWRLIQIFTIEGGVCR